MERFPVPLAAPQLPVPAVSAQVQLTPATLKIAGANVSATAAPVSLSGPLLVTLIVYVRLVPGTALVTPSVFVIARSAAGAVATSVVVVKTSGPPPHRCECDEVNVVTMLSLPSAGAPGVWTATNMLKEAPAAIIPVSGKPSASVSVSSVSIPGSKTPITPTSL